MSAPPPTDSLTTCLFQLYHEASASDMATFIAASPVTYTYSGLCPITGDRLALPRTRLAEQLARNLMDQLAQSGAARSRMYGILLVETLTGYRVIKGFSGQAVGPDSDRWVSPIPQRQQVVLSEFEVVAELENIKQTLGHLSRLPERQRYSVQVRRFEEAIAQLSASHRHRKAERSQQRQRLASESHADVLQQDLDNQSRHDSRERRQLKQERDRILRPLQQVIDTADAQIQELKLKRKQLSRQLQAQMHAVYTLTNFSGEQRTLEEIVPTHVMPTGTGECCAPKLLHHAAMNGYRPLAMAEFWWGTPSADGARQPRQFYGACLERCQPIMGFLLSGLPAVQTDHIPAAPVLYQDDWLVAIDKPAGLLSTPGRTILNPSNVVSRLRTKLKGPYLQTAHRLDQETSGVLLLARSPQVHRQLSAQFQRKTVTKRYEAIVTAAIAANEGEITLPIGRYPDSRPMRRVDFSAGKASHTAFRVLERCHGRTRLELAPTTGRTHQIRIHLADPAGLEAPILGDRAYGGAPSERLHLHAKTLTFWHPVLDRSIRIVAAPPF